MASSESIVASIRYLQGARVQGGPATPGEVEAVAEVWMDALADVGDPLLRAAIRAHVNDPERGRWWPTVADIRAKLPATVDDDVAAWDTMLGDIRAGRRIDADALDSVQAKALADIGGSWAIRNAEGGAEIGGLRKRFLAACKDGEAREITALRIEATPAPLRLAEDPRFREIVKRAGGR